MPVNFNVLIRRLLLLVVALVAAVDLQAKEWSADDIPMVHLQDRNRYVCDPDGLMTEAGRDSADLYLRKLQTECGVQTVLVVVNNVKGADCFRVAEDIGNKYGVGDKKTRRGLVVVIAVKDRRYFIAPGKGLEAELTDVECDDIARACIVRNMKVNDTDGAVLATAKALYSKFKTGSAGLGYDDDAQDDDDVLVVAVVLLLCFGLPIYFFVRDAREKKKGGGPRNRNRRRNNDDDWFPPFILGGGGGFGGGGSGFSGGSFGGGSFGGGGAGGGW